MSPNEKQLAEAFYADAVCEITYRDQSGRWTERTIRIEELRPSHVIARCEMRGNAYRRFNLNRIGRTALGAGGFLIGESSAPSAEEANEARELAYETTRGSAEREAFLRSRQSGDAEGLTAGEKSGGEAGTEAGSKKGETEAAAELAAIEAESAASPEITASSGESCPPGTGYISGVGCTGVALDTPPDPNYDAIPEIPGNQGE